MTASTHSAKTYALFHDGNGPKQKQYWNNGHVKTYGYRQKHRRIPSKEMTPDTLLHDDPPFERSLVALEIRADLDDFLVSGFVLDCIALVVNLFYGLFGGSIELEFK